MARIVLGTHASGLGDNLLFSTLPEGLTKRGNEVFISTQSTPNVPHQAPWYNDEIRQLVWEANPFVLGFVNEPPTYDWGFGSELWNDFVPLAKQIGPICAIEDLHGIDCTNDTPKVYYKPTIFDGFAKRTLIDPSSVSKPFPGHTIDTFVIWLGTQMDFDPSEVEVLTSKHAGYTELGGIQRKSILSESIFDYCDLIASCENFIGVQSGNSVLAAALRTENECQRTFSLVTPQAYNERIFTFPNVDYFLTTAVPALPDFKETYP